MTGRELIVHILSHNLENEPVLKDGHFVGFLTVEQAAEKMNVGTATIYAWITQEKLKGIVFGDRIYISANAEPPVLLNS